MRGHLVANLFGVMHLVARSAESSRIHNSNRLMARKTDYRNHGSDTRKERAGKKPVLEKPALEKEYVIYQSSHPGLSRSAQH
jgi:hypothetical protein